MTLATIEPSVGRPRTIPKPDGVVGEVGATVTLRVAVAAPEALLAVRLTVNVPADVYVWLGF
jgi:hypothetical protein